MELRYRIVTGALPSLYVRFLNYDLEGNRRYVGRFLMTSQPTLGVNPRRV